MIILYCNVEEVISIPIQQKDSELVLGLITTVGTEMDNVIKDIKDQLAFFRYTVEEISVSQEIISQFENEKPKFSSEYERISHYMDLGNKIRNESNDASILMKGVSRFIYQKRDKDSKQNVQPRKRVAYIINSIKHPEEVEFLRDTYGYGFHLIGVTSNYKRRIKIFNRKKRSK